MPTLELELEQVIFRTDLYPRIETRPATVQQYAEALELLPPITVNQHNELIDGWHRWTAHKKAGAKTIKAVVQQTASDRELMLLAVRANAKHGLQLSQADKKDVAKKIYDPDAKDSGQQKRQLTADLAVSKRTLRGWLARIDKDAKARRDRRIFQMHMACYTQQEIAEAVGCSQPEVTKILSQMAELPDVMKVAASHLVDFDVPLYNVWKFKEYSHDAAHPGNSEPTIVDNLLYLYTEPMSHIVVDPFAGSGSTRDVCIKRWRRYWVSDRKVGVEYEDRIRKWDLADGLPKVPRWKDVQLVYLDPPYWKQAEGVYSNDPTDLGNMPLAEFTDTLAGIIQGFAKKLMPGARIALLLQPTQWKAPEHAYTDHVADMICRVKLPIDMRVSCPYESQQCNAQMVEKARESKMLLVLTRELVIWKVG